MNTQNAQSNATHAPDLIETLKRCKIEMAATVRFIRSNPVSDYTVHYDGVECDGSCLADDCENSILAIDMILEARAKGVQS